ncbi:MAG: bis(5'-nucleosyl)-tetraphosphatase (symmetrical) YqeK [Cyanobacteria bacterium REEB446]|jgi:predicted HD superfamily hydrolase involved in NAD metabolism|nr:bis(5'-nucleosyl)-tetraphosphatase (symmetrical) YqeK [Cyanobacteria bacterium REEB446]
MTSLDLEKITESLRLRLSEYRFKHTLSVRETALNFTKSLQEQGPQDLTAEKAVLNDQYLKKIEIAALLHDYAKELENSEQLHLAKFYGLDVYPADLERPNLLHARNGAMLAEEELDIHDTVILSAIREHTFAGVNMTFASKIIFLADMAEPYRDERDRDPDLEHIRELIYKEHNLEAALIFGLQVKIQDTIKSGKMIHPLAVTAWNSIVGKYKQ